MNNEIKEILEDIKRHLDYVEATKQASIRDNQMKAMYDCITNLQEEINKLTSESTEWEERTYCWQDRAENLEIIIDRAIKIYKNRNTCEYKKERFMKGKYTSDLMYEILIDGDDNE